jgi:hypothetical protein
MKASSKPKQRHKESNPNSKNSYDAEDSAYSDQAVISDNSYDSENKYPEGNITEKMLADYINKYNTYQEIIEKIMPDEMTKIDQIVSQIYETCMDIYERECEEEENYELEGSISLYFNFDEEISKLKIEDRSNEDIIKLMYILSIHLSKYIHIHKEQYNNYTEFENLKTKLYAEINNVINNKNKNNALTNSAGKNQPKDTISVKKSENSISKTGTPTVVNENTIDGSKYRSINMYPSSNNYLQNQHEYAFINKISKDNCITVLDDLYTSYGLISKFLEIVRDNFTNLIYTYNLIIKTEKDIISIFLEELAILLLDDPFFKVKMTKFIIILYIILLVRISQSLSNK